MDTDGAEQSSSPVPTVAEVPAGESAPKSLCHVYHPDGTGRVHFDRATVEKLLDDGKFFWVDVEKPQAADFEILRDVFKFHPLAVEDSENFGQRAKIEGYDDFTFIVVFGAAPDEDRLVEVHCFYSEHFLVTVHRDDCPAFAEVRERYKKRAAPVGHPARLLYGIVDALVDSFFPILAEFDDRIDALENAIFIRADDRQLQEIFGMKRLLVGMRKAISPQRDAFARLMGAIDDLPGLQDADEHYFRDVYDHLIRISDLIDSYRDLLSGAMDVYLSTVSNRLNTVMKQLAIIATIFLPLTWITGFFGQNFSYLVRNVAGPGPFLIFAIGAEVLAVVGLLIMFKRRGWF